MAVELLAQDNLESGVQNFRACQKVMGQKERIGLLVDDVITTPPQSLVIPAAPTGGFREFSP